MTTVIAEIKIIGTEYWVFYHDEVVSKQKNALKAAEKLAKYIKGRTK